MKGIISALFLIGILCHAVTVQAQTKYLVGVNSLRTKEVITLKYNNKAQLIYLDEKGVVTYREFTFKYDKVSNLLTECIMNLDKGELVTSSKYAYADGYIAEEIKSSGKQVREKRMMENIRIHTDDKGRLTKTTFDDGKIWEEFTYDNNNNIVTYIQHSAMEGGDKTSVYKFNNDKSAFQNIESIPLWFRAWHVSNMRWCGDFIGKNNPNEITTEDPRFGTDVIEVTYEYDADGFPTKQYYNGELVREFTYESKKK